MKKILYILSLSAVILLASCSQSDNGNNMNNGEKHQEKDLKSSDDSENTKNNEEPEDNNEIGESESNDKTEESEDEIIIAPDFELESMDGTMIKLSDLRDKNVIINFWATWCGYCVQEMPDLQKLQDAYNDDLLILAVNVGETKEEVQTFIDDNELNLTVVLDKDMAVSNTYGVRSFPSTLAVNKKGEAVAGYMGMLTYEQMEELYGFFNENT